MIRYTPLFEEEADQSDKEKIKVYKDMIDKLEYKNKEFKIDLKYLDTSDVEGKGKEKEKLMKDTIDSNEESIKKLKQDIEDIKASGSE